MVVEGTEKLYKDYLKQKDSRWEYGNSILYQMCEKNPKHNDEDVIVGKLWIIGRTYAAAIERRKSNIDSDNDFYYENVAPKMMSIGKILDRHIDSLNHSSNLVEDDISEILTTHKFLMDAFKELTGLEKRSLASKYLHFHCPEKFFIYDSRAHVALNKVVKRPDKSMLIGVSDYDKEYSIFVLRMIELQNYLYKKTGKIESPRKLDSFLLFGMS